MSRDDGPSESLPDGWEQFTSPDGHQYYYNAGTKESRWDFPSKENEKAPNRSKPTRRSSKGKKEKRTTQELETAAAAARPSNVMFLKLQASLGGKLEAIHTGAPPMWNIRREGLSESTGGVAGQEEITVEEQYEAETAGMRAAERLRFLRKKRQENMMLKRQSSTGDDFMEEVANNMKKKGVVVRRIEEREGHDKVLSWEEQEKAEEERKRRQMQEEMQLLKKQETERNERDKEAAVEREEERERESAEQLELERRKQERNQRQEEEKREKQGKKEKKKMEKRGDELGECYAGRASDCHETSATGKHVQNHSSVVESNVEQGDEDLDVSSPERVKHKRHIRSRESKHGISVNRQAIKHMESVEDDHPPADDRPSPRYEVNGDAVNVKKQHKREERRIRKQREKNMLVAPQLSSVTSELPQFETASSSKELNEESQTRSTSSIEANEGAKAREKQLRRERRRMAKMEAALAAQNLAGTSGQENAQPVKSSEPYTDSSNGPTNGLAHAGSRQLLLGQPPISGGMYPPYPYMMMPPPPSPYGCYYPYVQPYSMPMPMYPPCLVPPGYQSMPPTPPHSANGRAVHSALVPYGTDSTLANAYGYDVPSSPELSRCDCCRGIGVGLVEKNGVCAHCNRLRLAFIVDSAQMRLRCSVCGGWGFQLLLANGMCEHCTRKAAQKSQRRLSRPSSVATSITAVLPRQTSAKIKSDRDEFDDIDWDRSSSDDSDWDD